MMKMENTKDKLKKKYGGRKTIRLVFFVFFIFVIAGISSVLTDRYVFPWLATRDGLSKYKFFKKGMENVTVINKTEQITVNENQTISGYTNKSASSVIEIVSRVNAGKDNFTVKSTSGIIVTADGLAVSFNNGFFDAKDAEYEVLLQDGKSYGAQVASVDPFSGLVLLKLAGAENIPVGEFIAPEDIKVGMKTAAIGRSGFDAQITLRLGIVSELAKSYSIAGPLASSEKMQGVLFLDSNALNKWDESLIGGAVTDYNGNFVGILGAKKEETGTKIFAIPVNHIRYVVDRYLAEKKIERAALGIYYIPLSKETAYSAGNGFERGALIYSPSGQQGLAVLSGSAADIAGLRILDIVLSAGGEEVNPDQNLAYLISKYKPGNEVNLKIVREGREMEVKAVLQ